MIDPAKLAELTASLMDELEEAYGSEAELGDVVIAVEVVLPDDTTIVEHRCTSSRAVVFAGLASMLTASALDGYRGDDDA